MVNYDGVRSDVCSVNQWSYQNAQIVCRELGYPGTMFARQGGYGTGAGGSVVDGYQCKSGIFRRI